MYVCPPPPHILLQCALVAVAVPSSTISSLSSCLLVFFFVFVPTCLCVCVCVFLWINNFPEAFIPKTILARKLESVIVICKFGSYWPFVFDNVLYKIFFQFLSFSPFTGLLTCKQEVGDVRAAQEYL